MVYQIIQMLKLLIDPKSFCLVGKLVSKPHGEVVTVDFMTIGLNNPGMVGMDGTTYIKSLSDRNAYGWWH